MRGAVSSPKLPYIRIDGYQWWLLVAGASPGNHGPRIHRPRLEYPMTWRPTIAALPGLCLALTTASGPAGAAAAPPAPRDAAHVNANLLAGPRGAPPGVCPGGT